jgi:hypothetical protein
MADLPLSPRLLDAGLLLLRRVPLLGWHCWHRCNQLRQGLLLLEELHAVEDGIWRQRRIGSQQAAHQLAPLSLCRRRGGLGRLCLRRRLKQEPSLRALRPRMGALSPFLQLRLVLLQLRLVLLQLLRSATQRPNLLTSRSA